MQQGGEQGETMERKPSNRPSSVPPKASGSESKRTDNGTSNKFPRNNKRRETNNARPRNDPGQSRQPTNQRSKAFDKRPRNRGHQSDRQRQEVTKDSWAEPGSAYVVGSKKASLNHLLNFTFAPREATGNSWGQRGGGNWKGRNNWSGKSVKYNKEHFLQANCQFIVKDSGSYELHSADPDTLVDWDLIEQVRIFSHEVPSCPICLYPPTAAKITRCGHIYCWACILHYLSLGEKSWRKCPICYESIHENDLKSVMALETHQYGVGEQIIMRLMKRERGSTVTLPRDQYVCHSGKPLNMEDDLDIQYAKLLLATPEQVHKIVEREKLDLEYQMKEEGEGTLEGSYVQSAMETLKERDKNVKLACVVQGEVAKMLDSAHLTEDIKPQPDKPPSPNAESKDVLQYSSAFDNEVNSTPSSEESPAAESTEAEQRTNIPEPSPMKETPEGITGSPPPDGIPQAKSDLEQIPLEELEEQLVMPAEQDEAPLRSGISPNKNQVTDTFYFYQAADGQHIYLNSINARCLVREYGSWENCPDSITANIVELEGISMTSELRRRLRYLSHLPLTCEFQVAELALKPPVLSKETIAVFAEDIEKRRRARQKKSREEHRFSRKAEAAEQRQMGIYPDMRMCIKSEMHFPQHGSPQSSGGASRDVSSTKSTPFSSPYGSPASALNPDAAVFTPGQQPESELIVGSPASTISDDGGQQSMSFAQMLRSGKSKPTEAWPKMVSSASAPVLGAGLQGVDSEDSGAEDRPLVPVYQSSFGDAIQEALDSYMNKDPVKPKDENIVTEVEATVVASGGKKKKNKKKLLFSTSVARAK